MKRNILPAAFATMLMILVMRWQGGSLISNDSPRAIVDLELAKTADRVKVLLMNWDLSFVRMNIWLDFIFIVTYVFFLSLAAYKTAGKWPEKTLLNRVGFILAKTAFAAGIFDIGENLFMLQTIAGNYTESSLQYTYYCAIIKFSLIVLILVYLLISLPVIFRKK
jgi:hypothetical protein